MRYKRLVCFFAVMMILFVALNYTIWKGFTEDLITDNHFDGGDLCRMGYILNSKMYRHNACDLPRRHTRLKDYREGRIDLVTIGDSFSNGGGGGNNRFYQDYIASLSNLSVLSLDEYKDVDFITMISILSNNGFLDQLKPRYVLIGATERGFRDLVNDIDFDKNVTMDEVKQFKIKDHYAGLPKVLFINNGNLKFILNALAFKFRDHGFFSEVHSADLTRDLFSVKDSRKLLYLPYNVNIEQREVEKLNDNMNKLADRLRNKGIQLIYMPYVDKYSLYSTWIVGKKFPASPFFEMLHPLPKRYRFIDTKALLQEELEKGEKDIFYPDDAHASWKASEKIFRTVKFAN